MNVVYLPVEGSRLKATEAQSFGERMEHLRITNDGALDPEIMLADAADPSSPLHSVPGITWVDSADARSWRLERMGYVFRSIGINIEADPEKPPQVIRVFWPPSEVAENAEAPHRAIRIDQVDEESARDIVRRIATDVGEAAARLRRYEKYFEAKSGQRIQRASKALDTARDLILAAT